jgi:hypothetical protein
MEVSRGPFSHSSSFQSGGIAKMGKTQEGSEKANTYIIGAMQEGCQNQSHHPKGRKEKKGPTHKIFFVGNLLDVFVPHSWGWGKQRSRKKKERCHRITKIYN